MLDIKYVRENPEAVRENLRKRGSPEKIQDLDRLLSLDSQWRENLVEADKLRRSRNEITQKIAEARKKGKDSADLIKQAEAIPGKIKELEARVDEYKGQNETILLNLPNMVHDSVPFGKDDNDNQELKRWGTIPQFNFKPRDHIDIGEKNQLIDLETPSPDLSR